MWAVRVRGVWQRLRQEGRDALELVLLPGVAALLPWPLAFRLFRWLARWQWLYRERCDKALALARQHGVVQDPVRWAWEQRLIQLVDHADHYMARTRGERWLRRYMDVHGVWGVKGQPALLMTFHWACGMWAQRHARASGLHPHMLVAAVNGPAFRGRWVLWRYVRARMRTVERAEGRPVIYVPGAMRQVMQALEASEQVLAVIDVPADQVRHTVPLRLLGRWVNVPAVLPQLAVQRRLPVTVYTLGLNVDTGRRDLRLYPLGVYDDAQALTRCIFDYFERTVQGNPAAWHFWGESERFFSAGEIQQEHEE